MDQYLPSGCGFRVVSVRGELGESANFAAYCKLKKWCGENCSGIWGYSTNIQSPIFDHKTYMTYYRRYFAFVDEEDILAVALFLGLDVVSIKAMWPSSTKFAIIYQEDTK
jgi:hypothetical protein